MKHKKLFSAMIIIGLLVAMIACNKARDDDIQEMGVTNLSSLHLSDSGATATPVLRVNQDGNGKVAEFLDGGTPVVSIPNGGGLQIDSGLSLGSFTDLTVTNGYTLTASYDVYALDSAGAVTITLAACSNDGQGLVLLGDDANTITINDTNVRTTDGNAATLGQYDVIAWICQDTEWLHQYKSANQ